MRLAPSLLVVLAIVCFLPFGVATSASYSGYLDVSVNTSDVSAGDAIEITYDVGNRDATPIVGGYVVLDLQHGCSEATYPSQLSDCDTVFWEEQVRSINLPSGGREEGSITYTVPEDAKSGTYRIDGYFKTNRSRVTGIPFIYLNPVSTSFDVTGSGSFPSLHINRTQTRFRGLPIPVGSWNPGTDAFEGTEWPWIAGPVGVFVNQTAETVPGRIVIENAADQETTGTVHVSVCEWDDTSCQALIDERQETVDVGPNDRETVRTAVAVPDQPGAYAVRIEVRKDDRISSVYRNRIIVAGETTRIRKLAVNRPYVPSDGRIAVRAVAGASPDHYTNPPVENVELHVAVEDLERDTQILDASKSIRRLSRFNALEGRWFNATVGSPLSRFNVSARLTGEDGQEYDRYHYIVDASRFAGPLHTVSLDDITMRGQDLAISLCGESESGIPASGTVQTVLRSGGDIVGREKLDLSPCGELVYTDQSEATGTLVVNAVEQERFDLDTFDLTSTEEDSNQSSQEQDREKPEPSRDDHEPPWLLIAFIVAAVIAGLLYAGTNNRSVEVKQS